MVREVIYLGHFEVLKITYLINKIQELKFHFNFEKSSFCFLVRDWFSKFYENETKHDKHNFKRTLTVTFEVKNSKNYWEFGLKLLQAYFSVGK